MASCKHACAGYSFTSLQFGAECLGQNTFGAAANNAYVPDSVGSFVAIHAAVLRTQVMVIGEQHESLTTHICLGAKPFRTGVRIVCLGAAAAEANAVCRV